MVIIIVSILTLLYGGHTEEDADLVHPPHVFNTVDMGSLITFII